MKAQQQSYPNADVVYIPNGTTFDPMFRCFYTKVILSKNAESDFYIRSKEHLISQSTKLFGKIHQDCYNHNMVYASKWINSFVGNIPLAAKVRLREMIESLNLDELQMQTDENYMKKNFLRAWGRVDNEFQFLRYRGIVSDKEKAELELWDRFVVENKLTHYNIKFKE